MVEIKDDGIPVVGPTKVNYFHSYEFHLVTSRVWTSECCDKWVGIVRGKLMDNNYYSYAYQWSHANNKDENYVVLTVYSYKRFQKRKILKIINSIEAS